MILKFSGHIGDNASALVDGQLSPQEEERAWSHILTCPGCRRLVEREGWIKSRLSTLSAAPAVPTSYDLPNRLLGALYDVDAWATVDEIERRSLRRRAALAVVGVGSVSVAVIGLVTLTTPPAGQGEVPSRPSPASIRADISGSPSATPTGGWGDGISPASLRRTSR